MFVCERGREAAAGSSIEKPDLDQVRLDDLLDRIFLFMNRSGDRAQPYRAAVELLDDRQEQFAIHLIETIRVNFHSVQGIARDRLRDAAVVIDRKSTRLNSSHMSISYAVFCLKKKKIQQHD